MKLYDETAVEYDIRQENPSTRHLRKWEIRTIKGFVKGRILDLGCGTGYHIDFLKSAGKNAFGVDISKEMLFSSRIKDNLIRADGHSLPFCDKSFDTIICMFSTLNLLEDMAIKEIRRILKDDGILITSVSSVWDKKSFPFVRKIRTKKIEEYMKMKTVHINKNIMRLRLFTKECLIGLLANNGFKMKHFYGVFLYQRPYWGRFDKFSFSERAMLWLDNLQLFKESGTVYICIFEAL